MLRSMLESILKAYLGLFSQAGGKVTIQSNWNRPWECSWECAWEPHENLLGSVECSMQGGVKKCCQEYMWEHTKEYASENVDSLLGSIQSSRLGVCCQVQLGVSMHQQNVKWFGSHNRTTQKLPTATPILPDAPRCFHIGWMQSDVLSDALRLHHRCSWILRKLWNRIQEYPEECIVVFKMFQNQTIRMCKFPSYWEYWPHLREYTSAAWTLSHTLREWLL